jgi:hypothetical protein
MLHVCYIHVFENEFRIFRNIIQSPLAHFFLIVCFSGYILIINSLLNYIFIQLIIIRAHFLKFKAFSFYQYKRRLNFYLFSDQKFKRITVKNI